VTESGMADRPQVRYGQWPSPISVEMAVASAIALREPRFDGDDVLWTEGRPAEAGRQVVVRWNSGFGTRDELAAGFNARTMASEYGGGAYAVYDGTLYFANLADGRIYRQSRGGQPSALTAEGPYRYGDLVVEAGRGRLLCVREDLTPLSEAVAGIAAAAGDRDPEPVNTLVAIDTASGTTTVVAAGHDFYSSPRPAPDGRRLAWLAWRHPNMPWDGTELWLAELDEAGLPRDPRLVAGGDGESIVQPEWAPDGSLVFASDRSGWWNLYRLAGEEPIPLAPDEAEFAAPQWVYGMSWFGIGPDRSIVAIVQRAGGDELWLIPAAGSAERIDVPDSQLSSLVVGRDRVCYLGSSATEPMSVVLLELASRRRRVLRTASDLPVDRAYLSVPQPITFPTSDGAVAHAIYYPPTNPDVDPPAAERPPLIVMSHGGPTGRAGVALDLGKQLFTSRGYALVDVNYRGSSGYGRAYRRQLEGRWGIVDVDDCLNAARYLAGRGDVDGERMAIRGGSAGGYTTLCALAFHDLFACGASHYGVGDLEALARHTHKFESHYLDRLVAPYPERVEVYRQRSPIYFVDRINAPLIVLQGRDDRVVPLDQAEQLVAALRERQIPHAYLVFDGEGHGFRQAANIRRALEAELSFYAQIFGIPLGDEMEPVAVEFLAARGQ
jgi:dipeptidyl aminopeptidase/acylaminoacyl peptidase